MGVSFMLSLSLLASSSFGVVSIPTNPKSRNRQPPGGTDGHGDNKNHERLQHSLVWSVFTCLLGG